jgi:hypothetical protein
MRATYTNLLLRCYLLLDAVIDLAKISMISSKVQVLGVLVSVTSSVRVFRDK